jgi:hypothetical protein
MSYGRNAGSSGLREPWTGTVSTPDNNQLPASFALLTATIMARIREPRRQL